MAIDTQHGRSGTTIHNLRTTCEELLTHQSIQLCIRNFHAQTKAMFKYDAGSKSFCIDERADVAQVMDALGNPQKAQLALPPLPGAHTADDDQRTPYNPPRKVDIQDPPTKEATAAAVSALSARPFFASGLPSNVVATAVDAPGIPNMIDEIAPPYMAP